MLLWKCTLEVADHVDLNLTKYDYTKSLVNADSCYANFTKTTFQKRTQIYVLNADSFTSLHTYARSIEIVPWGRLPFWLMGSCFGWWNLEAGPTFGWWNLEVEPFWLMNSRGGPHFWGCILMNSRDELPGNKFYKSSSTYFSHYAKFA